MSDKRPFLSEEEFDELMHAGGKRPYEVFNEVLDRVYGRALEASLLKFPEVALKLVQHSAQLVELRKEFFEKNADMQQQLPAFKEALAYYEEKEPAAEYKSTLNKAAEAVRQGRTFGRVDSVERALPTGTTRPNLGAIEDVDESFKGVLDHGKPISNN